MGTRSFMGLTLNYNFGRDLNVVYLTKHGEYDASNYETVKDFGYDAHLSADGYHFSLSMEFTSDSHKAGSITTPSTMFFVVTGSSRLSLSAPCGPKVSAPVVCQPTSNDFYFTALRLGHARRKHEEGITNRTWSRCALRGPSKYRGILDRSQRLTLTYSFFEDVELMRQQDKGRNLSIALINGKQVSQHNDYEFFVNEDGKWS
ncbi:unnamed protein product [Toxocara canis]|uniref:OMP_b-brl_3 domain-containing protein n=1 Tax=Toxocara canis TaxID=6265 RepID=A0A183UPT8_TOXCA|nr:unnamed protein product [Toxocara canis]